MCVCVCVCVCGWVGVPGCIAGINEPKSVLFFPSQVVCDFTGVIS